jgi:hypothetical protein
MRNDGPVRLFRMGRFAFSGRFKCEVNFAFD